MTYRIIMADGRTPYRPRRLPRRILPRHCWIVFRYDQKNPEVAPNIGPWHYVGLRSTRAAARELARFDREARRLPSLRLVS